MLHELNSSEYGALKGIAEIERFPMTAAVVYGLQNGHIYVDDANTPGLYLIINKSGRGYLYLTAEHVDYARLLDFMWRCDDIPDYFHISNASEELIAAATAYDKVNTKVRMRMRMQKTEETDESGIIDMRGLTAKRIDEVDNKDLLAFGVDFVKVSWKSIEEMKATGIGWVIYENDIPITLWYPMSVANYNSETDIITLPEFRGKGSATVGCALILKTLKEKGVRMDWDLFQDNIPSLKLAHHFKYETYFPYTFLSIFKVKEGQSS